MISIITNIKHIFSKIFLLYLLIIFTLPVTAQQIFQKTYGGPFADQAHALIQTTDGGYLMAGETQSFGTGGIDILLVRTDGSGDTLWTKTFGGSSTDRAYDVQQTADGGFIIAGETFSFRASGADIYLIKTDANGELTWSSTIGGGAADNIGRSVQQTDDGGYIIAGETNSYGAGALDMYLVKADTNGIPEWTKTFGGTTDDYGYSVLQTSDNGYVIAGYTRSYGNGKRDVYVVKTDPSGNEDWVNTYGATNDNEWGFSINQTMDGGFIIGGERVDGDSDFHLIKIDGNGNPEWSNMYGSSQYEYFKYVSQTADSGYIAVGYTYSSGNADIYLLKTDAAGDEMWNKTYGGTDEDYGHHVIETANGGYAITGQTQSSGAGNWDFHLILTDASGTSGCMESNITTSITSTTMAVNTGITVDSGGVYDDPDTLTIAGGTTSDIGILCDSTIITNSAPVAQNDAANTVVDSAITADVLANDSDPDGDALSTNIITQPANGTAVVLNNDSIEYTPATGFSGNDTLFYQACDAGSLCDSAFLFINVKADSIPDLVQDIASSSFSVFPNPSNGVLEVILNNHTDWNAYLEVYNVLGVMVHNKSLLHERNKIDLSSFAEGLYFFKVKDGMDVLKVEKVIIKKN